MNANKICKSVNSTTTLNNIKKTYQHPDAVALLLDAQAKWEDNEIKEVLKTYLEYCTETEEGLSQASFCWKQGIPFSTFRSWGKKDWARRIMQIGTQILATRRMDMAEFKKIDKDLFIRHQHLYDPNYHEDVNEYWRRMKTDEQLQEAFKLFIYAAENTGRVPSKEEKRLQIETKKRLEAPIQ